MSINNLNTYLNIKDSHLRVVSGNVYAQAMNIGGINVETAHGLQSVSDTGNVTSNTLQFSNAITGFVTTANAQIGRDLVVSGNTTVSTDLTVSANATVTDTLTISEHLIASKEATVTGNLHVTTIQSDSNVVAEYTGPHDRPLRKYPEVALTANSDKGYVAIGSSNGSGSYPEYTAFDGVVTNSTTGWASDGTYASGTGISTFSWNGSFGEYLSLELPKALRLQKMFLKGYEHSGIDYQNAPRDIKLYGSNNETNWVLLKTETDLPIDSITNNSTYININATEHYKYIRLQITKTYRRTAAYTRIGELEYYGHEEGSGSLDTTLKTVYNVPATTGTQLDVYYDAKETSSYSGSGTTVNDLAGTQQNGTFNGGFDSTYKAFTFNGTSQNMTTTLANSGTPSAYAHTFAFWTKPISNLANHIQQAFLQLGTHSANSCSALRLEESTGLFRWFFHSNDIVYSADHIKIGEWNHIVAAYDGGSELTSRRIWVNDKEIHHTTTSGTIGALSLSANALLAIGSQDGGSNWNNGLNGSIANFRLFSKALNADQVRELYDYQKDYFLGSKSQVTLYKGHLGVGVTEPSGQLELAGDERIQEYPPRALTGYETLVEGHGVFCVDFANWYSGNTPWGMYKKNNDVGGQENVWYGPYQNNNGYSGGNVYTGTDFAASTTSGLFLDDVDGTRYYGAWTTIAMPYDIYLKQIHIHQGGSSVGSSTSCAPEDGVILGSNDGTKWYHVHTFTGLQYGGTAGTSSYSAAGEGVVVNAKRPYSHYALITTRTHHNDFTVIIGELRWFGTPGPTTLDKGSLTLGRSLDVPRISRYDVDTETPRPEKLVLDFDTTVNSSPTDISGKGNHGTFNGGATYSPADKAFDIPDAGNISATLTSIPSADFVHSVSVWVKFEGDTLTTSYPYLYFMGTNLSYSGFGLFFAGAARPNQLHVSCWQLDYPINFTFSNDTWHHVTYTYSGGGWSRNSSLKAYVDGIEYGFGTNWSTGTEGTTPTIATSNVPLRLGTVSTGGVFDGKISNFKLYSVVLEPSEVKKLYNLGRTGRSMVISDTAVGIGKVPEAQLDVRGNLNVDGIITSDKPAFHVWRNAGDITTTDTAIVWNQVRFNRGNCYNSSDGFFTAPVSGMYFFSVFGMSDGHAAAVQSFRFKIAPPGGSEGDFINAFWPYQYSHASTGQHVSCAASFVYYLDAGAKFRVYHHGTELLGRDNAHNGYSGFLIG